MNRLLIILTCVVALPLGSQPALNAPTAGGFNNFPGASAAYVFQENFEGTGYENGGWSESGTPNEDYTTTVLNGSQSWASTATTSYAVIDLGTDYDSLYLYFRWRRGGAATTPQTILLLNSSDTIVAAIAVGNGSGIAYNGSTSSGGFGTSADTTYSGWLEFTKGSGANGVTTYYQATSTTKPGSATASVTTGNATTAARKLKLSGIGASTFIIDYIRVSTSSIGSAPP